MVNNEDILKDILLKMNYNPSKTLNENIEEQMGEKPWMTPRGMSYSENLKALQGPPLTKEQRHLLMDIAAFGTLFIPVIGPFVSLGIELANAGLYYSEGDEYMTGFSLAFALIPMGELIGRIPAVKKLGRDGLASLIKKARSGGNATKIELEALQQIRNNSDDIIRLATTAAKTLERLKILLSKAKFSDIVYMMYKLSKKYPKLFTISKFTIQMGGIMYGWDKIAEIYGIGNEQSTPQNQKVKQEEFERYYENHKEEVNVDVMNNVLELDTIEAGKLAIDYLSSVE